MTALHWVAGPAAAVLPARVQTCDLDLPADGAEALLTSEEIARADRFVFARDRHRFIAGRAFLRQVLGAELGLAPQLVPLRAEAHGRPFVPGGGLSFNLSHSGALAVLAISREADVGIDVEQADHRSRLAEDIPLLAPRVLVPAEIAALDAAAESERLKVFLSFWTAKEAMMKLTGAGLALDPRAIALRLDGGRPTGYLTPPAPAAQLWHVPMPDTSAICHLAIAQPIGAAERRSA